MEVLNEKTNVAHTIEPEDWDVLKDMNLTGNLRVTATGDYKPKEVAAKDAKTPKQVEPAKQ